MFFNTNANAKLLVNELHVECIISTHTEQYFLIKLKIICNNDSHYISKDSASNNVE